MSPRTRLGHEIAGRLASMERIAASAEADCREGRREASPTRFLAAPPALPPPPLPRRNLPPED